MVRVHNCAVTALSGETVCNTDDCHQTSWKDFECSNRITKTGTLCLAVNSEFIRGNEAYYVVKSC